MPNKKKCVAVRRGTNLEDRVKELEMFEDYVNAHLDNIYKEFRAIGELNEMRWGI